MTTRGYRLGIASDIGEALKFHTTLASGPFLWPRSEKQLREYAANELLFGAWDTSSDELIGLCYSKWEERENAWEAGGITVRADHQGRGVGPALFRLALASTLLNEDPWTRSEPIIAHVHANNPSPIGMMNALGFREHQVPLITTAGGEAPKNMQLIQGFLIGRVFCFEAKGVDDLLSWFGAFDGRLKEVPVELAVGERGKETRWLEAVREMLAETRARLSAGTLKLPPYETPAPEAPLDDLLVAAVRAGELRRGAQSPWLDAHLARLAL